MRAWMNAKGFDVCPGVKQRRSISAMHCQLAIEIARRCNMARGVTGDKTHIEHNETALDLIAHMPRDMDFCCNGSGGDIGGANTISVPVRLASCQLSE